MVRTGRLRNRWHNKGSVAYSVVAGRCNVKEFPRAHAWNVNDKKRKKTANVWFLLRKWWKDLGLDWTESVTVCYSF